MLCWGAYWWRSCATATVGVGTKGPGAVPPAATGVVAHTTMQVRLAQYLQVLLMERESWCCSTRSGVQ